MAEGPGERSVPGLSLRGLTRSWGSTAAVRDLDLDVPRGSYAALLGPSGCGKTTTLRLVAGLEEPTSGTVRLAGRDVTALPAHRRPVNTVFQGYALFPHLDVHDNVAFGLRRGPRGERPDRREVARRVGEALELVRLGSLARRRPARLSGGEQQRVALARALVNRPEVLLLDEPLAALDAALRRSLQGELRRVQREVGLTFLHVTHDQEEALAVADVVAVMAAGRVQQVGAPLEVWERPATPFVARFLGGVDLLGATVHERGADGVVVAVAGTRAVVAPDRADGVAGAPGTGCLLGVRPERLHLGPPGGPGPTGRVEAVDFTGASHRVLVRLASGEPLRVVRAHTGRDAVPRPGESVGVCWRPEDAFLLPPGADHDADHDAGTA